MRGLSSPVRASGKSLLRYLSCLSSAILMLSGTILSQAHGPVHAGSVAEAAIQPTGPGKGAITALAADPFTAGVFYAGTENAGVYKSTDDGNTWFSITAGMTFVTGHWGAIQSIAVDPQHPLTIFAGTLGNGIFKTTDGGNFWQPANSTPVDILNGANVNAIAVSPSSSNTVYSSANNGLAKSTDGGNAWLPVLDNYPNALAVNPIDPNTIYAGSRGIYRSTDGGVHWSNPALVNLPVYSIAVDPASPNTVYAGTLDFADSGSVYKSNDGGATWSLSASSLQGRAQCIVIQASVPKTIYVGTSESVYRSTDGGANWAAVNTGLPTVSINAIAFDSANPSIICVGTSGHGSFFRSTDRGSDWTEAGSGLPAARTISIASSPADSSTIYSGTADGGIYRSFDRGASWHFVAQSTGSVNALAFNPTNSAVIYAGGIGGLSRSTDNGKTWTTTLVQDVGVVAIDPVQTENVYAGSLSRGAYKSTDAGVTWSAINSGLLPGQTSVAVTAIAIDPHNSNGIYAGAIAPDATPPIPAGVFVSTNAGADWTLIKRGLGLYTEVNCLAINASNPDTIIGGTSFRGIIKSTDAGQSWTVINTGLPDQVVTSVAISPFSPSIVYAGTRNGVSKSTDGGGTWSASGPDLLNPQVNAVVLNSGTVYVATDSGVARIVYPQPSIQSALFDGKKNLSISGNNFDNSPRVLINGIDRTSFIKSVSSSQIKLKGKGLGLAPGPNTIQVVNSTGAPSNVLTLSL